ncbi:MAG: oligosaccharide flippase family protein [Candidatus Aenigmarchaeota archaeon]|nr:oligosaccharide flippase family protein [Candidatus Aenigmarchaeota archaeon]
MDARKKVFSNVAYLSFDWGFVALISLVFSFVLWKTLLPNQYGIIATTINFTTIVSTFSLLGFSSALPKLISEYLQKKNFKTVNELIRFSIKIILVAAILLSASILLTLDFVSNFTNLPKDALLIGAVSVFVFTVYSLFASILSGFQNMRLIFVTDVVGYSVRIVLLLLLIFIGMQYMGALIAVLVSFAIISILRFKTSWLRGEKNHIDKKTILFDYAFSGFVSSIALLVFFNSQTIILSVLKNLTEAGLFGTAFTMAVPIYSIPNILSGGLFPVTSQLSANKKGGKQQSQLVNLVLKYSLFIVVPLIVILVFFSKPIILLFSRPEYLGASQLLPIVALASLANGIGSLFLSSLYAIKRPILYRNIIIFSSLVFILLAITMTILWSSYGLSVAYLASTLLMAGITFIFLKKHLSMKFPFSDIGKIILASIALYVTLFLIDFLSVSTTFKLILASIGGLIYLISLIPLRFYGENEVQILKYASDKMPRMKKYFNFIIRIISNKVPQD